MRVEDAAELAKTCSEQAGFSVEGLVANVEAPANREFDRVRLENACRSLW